MLFDIKTQLLIDAGAKVETQHSANRKLQAESTLHWIIAFDNGDQKDAISLLIKAGAEVTANISWNHPFIDLPGKFPLGTPFHYAAYFNNPSLVQVLLQYPDKGYSISSANIKGSSMITPLEFAVRYHRYEVILPLLKGGALDYPDINASVLHEVSNLPSYESWATGGLLGLRPDEAAGLCTSILLDWCPHLLEQGDTSGYGTTPLMTACYYHSQVVVQCLIERKCNINA